MSHREGPDVLHPARRWTQGLPLLTTEVKLLLDLLSVAGRALIRPSRVGSGRGYGRQRVGVGAAADGLASTGRRSSCTRVPKSRSSSRDRERAERQNFGPLRVPGSSSPRAAASIVRLDLPHCWATATANSFRASRSCFATGSISPTRVSGPRSARSAGHILPSTTTSSGSASWPTNGSGGALFRCTQ